MKKNEIVIKILGLGDSGVGQTCILRRYVENKFVKEDWASKGVYIKSKNINLNKGKAIKFIIFDTTGKDYFWNLLKKNVKNPDALILIYDITDNYSYDHLNILVKNLKFEESFIKIPIILVGNKIDLKNRRKITREQGYKFADKNGFLFIECSALTGENVNNIFNKLVLAILEKDRKSVV